MKLEQGQGGGGVVALLALETPLLPALMRLKVGLKVALHRESETTVRTVKGLLFGVDPLVLLDLGGKPKSFGAELAAEVLGESSFRGVMTAGQVGPQVARGLEPQGTQVTLVAPLIRVTHHVIGPQSLADENFRTYLAVEVLVSIGQVSMHVDLMLQRGLPAAEFLSTMLTSAAAALELLQLLDSLDEVDLLTADHTLLLRHFLKDHPGADLLGTFRIYVLDIVPRIIFSQVTLLLLVVFLSVFGGHHTLLHRHQRLLLLPLVPVQVQFKLSFDDKVLVT